LAIAADQLTKLIVSSQLTLDEASTVGPFSIHHVPELGIALASSRARRRW
jgi:lipoprotein signal peptidase